MESSGRDFKGFTRAIALGGGLLLRYPGVALQFPTAAMVRMTLEKQASILEGALRRNPSSTRLHLAALHLTDQLQEHAVVDSLWKEAIDK